MKRMNFTDTTIDTLSPPTQGFTVIGDTVIKPLKLRLGRKGCTWVFRTAASYKTLGSFPMLSTDLARRAALAMMQGTALPTLPIQPIALTTPDTKNDTPTLEVAVKEYITTRQLKPTTARQMASSLATLGDYFTKPLNELTPDAFSDWFKTKLKDGKPTTAAMIGRYVRAVFKWSVVRYGLHDLPDPTLKVRTLTGEGFTTKAKNSRLTLDSLPRWWAHVGALPDDATRVLLRTYLLTGARKTELLELHHKDILIDPNGIVVVTLIDTKNGTDHTLRLGTWLSAQWVKLLTGKPKTGLVFAGQATRLRRQVEQIAKAMASDAVGIHDLRRSFASFAHEAGIDMPTLKACMNHAAAAGDVTTRHYLRVSPDAMARAWQTVEHWIIEQTTTPNNTEF